MVRKLDDNNIRILRDAIHNTHQDVVRRGTPGLDGPVEYGRGIIVGVVAGMMAAGDMSFDQAWLALLSLNRPVHKSCIPENWPSLNDYTYEGVKRLERRLKLLADAHTRGVHSQVEYDKLYAMTIEEERASRKDWYNVLTGDLP